jgi:amylovoran biosynthesis glycosyltransferase AmsB
MIIKLKFSVIIPTYNSSKTIVRSLQSIIDQTLEPYEVIVIDDGSSDYEALKCKVNEFNVPNFNIHLLRNESNLNASVARNRGIDFASGDYIAFMDADDEWENDKLYRYDQEINLYGNQYVYFSQVAVILDGEYKSTRPVKGPIYNQDISEYLFLDGGFIQTSSIIVSRELAAKVKFDERFRRHQDYDFCLRASCDYQFRFLKTPLSRYHVSQVLYNLKSENSKYCLWWLHEMKPYITKRGYFGYMLFPLSARLFNEKKYYLLFRNILSSIIGLGFKGLISSRGKLADVFR